MAQKLQVSSPKYAVGQAVRYINQQGVDWGCRTIAEVNTGNQFPTETEPRYYITPTDTPWFPVQEACLTPWDGPAPGTSTSTRGSPWQTPAFRIAFRPDWDNRLPFILYARGTAIARCESEPSAKREAIAHGCTKRAEWTPWG